MKRKIQIVSNEDNPIKRRKISQPKEIISEECKKIKDNIKKAKLEIKIQKNIIRENRKLFIKKYTNEMIKNLKDKIINEITLLEGTFKMEDFPVDKYVIEETDMEVRINSQFEAEGYDSGSPHYSIGDYDNHDNNITELHLSEFLEGIDSSDLEWEECERTKFGSDCYCDVICSIYKIKRKN